MSHSSKVLFLGVVLALSACSKKENATAQSPTAQPLIVKIGQASPLTGPQAAIGKDNETARALPLRTPMLPRSRSTAATFNSSC